MGKRIAFATVALILKRNSGRSLLMLECFLLYKSTLYEVYYMESAE
jgi:hypothetical protein